jgi:hypothetical protein
MSVQTNMAVTFNLKREYYLPWRVCNIIMESVHNAHKIIMQAARPHTEQDI